MPDHLAGIATERNKLIRLKICSDCAFVSHAMGGIGWSVAQHRRAMGHKWSQVYIGMYAL